MQNSPIIPYDYATWQHCITVKCGLELTADFISQRLQILGNPNEYERQRFLEIYGAEHLQRVLAWFAQAQR